METSPVAIPSDANSSSAVEFIEALRTFNAQHPQRVRIEGAQSTAIASLSSAVNSLRSFNQKSDAVFAFCSESFSKHVQLLALIKRDLTLLEDRVTKAKARAIRIAEHDGIDLSFLDTPLMNSE